jgi:hypothetical protein
MVARMQPEGEKTFRNAHDHSAKIFIVKPNESISLRKFRMSASG